MNDNKKLLTIIIPQRNENESVINHLLSSINLQVGIDLNTVEVKIIGDGGYKLKAAFFSNFSNLDIQYVYYYGSQGPGYARQKGLEYANARYLTYMDADDQLNTVNALCKFVNVIKKTGDHDVIFSKYVEEHPLNEHHMHTYTLRGFNPSAAYGKWLNVEYLRKHKLRWHPLLPYVYEDTYFMDTVLSLTDDIYYLDSPTYSWLYNANSIVRTGSDYNCSHVDDYILENRLWIANVKKRAPQKLYHEVNNCLVNIYHFMHVHQPTDQIKTQVNDELRHFFLENDEYLNINDSIKILIKRFPTLNPGDYNAFLNQWANNLHLIQVNNQPLWSATFLSIIVPFYGGNIARLYPLMFSIYNQVNFDLSKVEILIIKDGGENLNRSIIFDQHLQYLNLNIKYFYSKNNIGPGPSRNIGLHHASGRFVMFCDADDQLYQVNALALMMDAFKHNDDAQIVMGKYVSEQVDTTTGDHSLLVHEADHGSSYANWYDLKFLRSYLIEFNANLQSYYEGKFFAGIASRLASNKVLTDNIVYTHTLDNGALNYSKAEQHAKLLSAYCIESYYWLEEAKIRFPERVYDDLNNFIINLYDMYYRYQVHSEKLDNEIRMMLTKILNRNDQYWNGWSRQLQSAATAKNVSGQSLHIFIIKFID